MAGLYDFTVVVKDVVEKLYKSNTNIDDKVHQLHYPDESDEIKCITEYSSLNQQNLNTYEKGI